jgi:acetolactate synthase-1/3 small subunit
METPTRRTFIVYVEDRPGVLNRVASLFRRRGYNIISLNVGRTHETGVSRMTMVVEADDDTARIMEANLYKLVNVLSVEDITHAPAVTLDLALIKSFVKPEQRAEALDLAERFRARVTDVSDGTMMFEITGPQDKIMEFAGLLEPYGVAEMVQTGTVSMTRGTEGYASRVARNQKPNADAA